MTALAPLSMAYLMVGRAPTMRCLLVIFLSESSGTLKSTLKQCVLVATSIEHGEVLPV